MEESKKLISVVLFFIFLCLLAFLHQWPIKSVSPLGRRSEKDDNRGVCIRGKFGIGEMSACSGPLCVSLGLFF